MGTEYGLLGLAVALLVCLSIGRLCLYYRRRQAKLTHQTERWNEIVAMAELMVFDYDVMADELMLTDPCARLFRLPTRQKHYTDLRQKKLDAQHQQVFDSMDQAITEGDAEQRLRFYRLDNSLGIFLLKKRMLYDEKGRLSHIIGMFTDYTDEFRREERIATRAQLDGLTRVYNSGAIRRLLSERLSSTDISGTGVFFILDLDRFKLVNDTYGHQMGDRVLQLLAKTLQESVRSTDYVGRLGGDEFCLFLPEMSSFEAAERLAGHINEAVRQKVTQPEFDRPTSVSIGGAMIYAEDSFKDAYARADQALYKAKAKGRDTYVIEG